MTYLDELDAITPDAPEEERVVLPRTPRRHRHAWEVEVLTLADPISGLPATRWRCRICRRPKDETQTRRGRSSRRLGHDGERRSEKRYGWRKVGEFGGITDLQGKVAIVQQKTTRAAPPVNWKAIFARLDERAGGRVPLILLSFVKQGVDTEDFIVVRGRDWLALFGRDDPESVSGAA